MEANKKTGARSAGAAGRRVWLVAGLAAALGLVGSGVYIGVVAGRGPDPVAVETSFTAYVEGLAVAGKIILIEARERLVISQTTPGLLFGDTSLGRFLGIRADATIEASAWADLAFVVDLYAQERWSARYDPEDGGTLRIAAPPIAILTPAIHTDTIEIVTKERSIFLDEKRLEASALRGLTARFVEAASALIDEPELRTKAREALEALARLFAANSGLRLERVEISFAPPEG